jgi:hypothetical protein
MFRVPEKYRLKTGEMGSDLSFGNNGVFVVPINQIYAFCIASDGEDWEHVSITLSTRKGKINRCPNWEEMCTIKSIFWEDTDCVIQFHPPKEDYVNNNKYCLHLWKPISVTLPRPHYSLVGTK